MIETVPTLFLSDGNQLVRLRGHLSADELARSLENLRLSIAAIPAQPWSVLDKSVLPPSGDKHDYVSLAPYWWADPDTVDGLPYFYRDGQVNPQIHDYDRHRLDSMVSAVQVLSLQTYLFNDETSAQCAENLLRVFLIDPETRMNPSMRFGQFIPGRSEGTPAAIVDARVIVPLAEAVALLRACSSPLSKATGEGCALWFEGFLDWLLTSEQGVKAGKTKNNHSTMYDLEIAALALHLGRREQAEKTLCEVGPHRIATQIEPDGSQPHELGRTRSWTYSTLNLSLLCRLARLGEHVGADLWNYEAPNGGSIRAALDYILRHAQSLPESWPRRQLTRFEPDLLAQALRLALHVWPEETRYREALTRVEMMPSNNDAAAVPGVDGLLVRLPLLFPVPPAHN